MWDALIVGGGISGVYAAYLLREKGYRVLVLEAQSRLGGRLYTVYTPEGWPVDLGGQWVGPQQTHLLRLIEKLGLGFYPTPMQGDHLLVLPEGGIQRYKGSIPKLPWLALVDLGWGLHRFRAKMKAVHPQAPWHITEPTWEAITLAEWSRSQFRTILARELFNTGMATVLGCEPEEVSLWHALFYARSAGSLEALIETEGGAQAYKITPGASVLVETLAQFVPYQIDQPVIQITYCPDKVEVRTLRGDTFQARWAIIAIPPAMTARIHWSPPLPPLYQQLGQRMPMGAITKVVAFYERPFWRDKGYSGHVVKLAGALRTLFDTSPPNATYGQLTGFGVGALARALLTVSPEARTDHYQQELTKLWGTPPQRLYVQAWSGEPFIGGGYGGYFPPGGWRFCGQVLRKPLPPLYWAGTERSPAWMGYIEGALIAAQNAVENYTKY
ncbi:MAG: FAD-dependent oxidoreductase [Bacteroidia bacterium]|nr:FAD-dependent oxidoreductase [Bacteroidia bacterium]MDW8236083.1 NAD(P)/FAD-dependent oxidoreductase [Bacteroidia bacterium]